MGKKIALVGICGGGKKGNGGGVLPGWGALFCFPYDMGGVLT